MILNVKYVHTKEINCFPKWEKTRLLRKIIKSLTLKDKMKVLSC